MTRRFLIVLLFLAFAPAVVQAASLPELSAASTDTDLATGDQVFKGNARLDYDGAVLLGDQIRYNVEKQTATARGHVSLTRGVQRLLADEIVYRLADKTYSVNRLRFGQYPLYASGDQASGTTKEIELHHVSLSYHEPSFFGPTLTAEKLSVIPGDRIVAERAWLGPGLGLGSTPIIPLHRLDQSINVPLISHMTAKIGQSHSLGYYADLGLHLPVAPGVKIGGDVGYYTSRGLLLGPSGTYDVTSPDQEDSGSLKSGYINDHGDKKTDILNHPIHDNRGFIQWEHERTYSAQNVTIINELNYWSDSSVVRDFRASDFYKVQQPDSFVDATATGTNTVTSLFIRAQPNTYYHVQQRMPELSFTLLPTAIGNGFYERFDASAVALRERRFSLDNDVLTTAPTLKSNRLDAFYSLSRPIVPRDWLVIDPVAGARVTEYLDATGGKSTYTRALGEIGVDASLRASAVYDYKNEAWGINGIRHLITPKLSYRYIPSADKGQRYIPQIAARVFDTALPTLELGDQRNIDDLSATNILRLGLDNTFQTRDKTYGSRDLLTFNVAEDFRFRRAIGEKDASEIHTGVSFMPANWMQLDVYNSFAPQTFTARELNTRFALHDGSVWSLSVSNQYLQHQIDEYATEGRYRINEVYQVVGRLNYDARKSRFNERTIALRQNINNLWTVQYNVHTYAGNTREGNFGFSVEVRLAGF